MVSCIKHRVTEANSPYHHESPVVDKVCSKIITGFNVSWVQKAATGLSYKGAHAPVGGDDLAADVHASAVLQARPAAARP